MVMDYTTTRLCRYGAGDRRAILRRNDEGWLEEAAVFFSPGPWTAKDEAEMNACADALRGARAAPRARVRYVAVPHSDYLCGERSLLGELRPDGKMKRHVAVLHSRGPWVAFNEAQLQACLTGMAEC
ncbi:hypothetical protein BF49_2555 [Bradyrhizobium sp.]|uniref:hypothetical protein n=1 Tax=Bradyrhizobium sp. TaxID=376 RepID=UPI0007C1771B|nr:hypothetical protein [Bradyrhizobium sp.]CUT11475.1 hypothetical protein BF49_2555 [Bradyrhizobium sp.]